MNIEALTRLARLLGDHPDLLGDFQKPLAADEASAQAIKDYQEDNRRQVRTTPPLEQRPRGETRVWIDGKVVETVGELLTAVGEVPPTVPPTVPEPRQLAKGVTGKIPVEKYEKGKQVFTGILDTATGLVTDTVTGLVAPDHQTCRGHIQVEIVGDKVTAIHAFEPGPYTTSPVVTQEAPQVAEPDIKSTSLTPDQAASLYGGPEVATRPSPRGLDQEFAKAFELVARYELALVTGPNRDPMAPRTPASPIPALLDLQDRLLEALAACPIGDGRRTRRLDACRAALSRLNPSNPR